jgi:hypothetical protein
MTIRNALVAATFVLATAGLAQAARPEHQGLWPTRPAAPVRLAQNYPITGITITLPANPDAKAKTNKGGAPKSKPSAAKDMPKSKSRGVGDNNSPIPTDR